MRVLNIAKNVATVADVQSTAVDLNTKLVPFVPGNSMVVALGLDGSDDQVLTVEGADDAAFTLNVTAYFVETIGAAAAVTKTVYANIVATKQFIRVKSVEGVTALGAFSADLLQN